MKKTIEAEYAVNEWGLIFPIPIQFWPHWGNYATIDRSGNSAFWERKPPYGTPYQGYYNYNMDRPSGTVTHLGIDINAEYDVPYEHLIWERKASPDEKLSVTTFEL
jgi:hypothetical protein